jgi:hypothetical protein
MSMIGLDSPEVCLMKHPPTGGGEDATARAMLLGLYAGIPLIPPPAFNPVWASTQANKAVGYKIEPR